MDMKKCQECKEDKPLEFFVKVTRSKDGLSSGCRSCRSIYNKAYYKLHPTVSMKNSSRSGGYAMPAISNKELLEMISNHSGVCDLSECERPATNTDHCHEAGNVRGRLCREHNVGLGMFHDRVEELESAIAYLRAHPPIFLPAPEKEIAVRKLTGDQVREIRAMREGIPGPLGAIRIPTHQEIGDKFGVSWATVLRICKRQTWKHV